MSDESTPIAASDPVPPPPTAGPAPEPTAPEPTPSTAVNDVRIGRVADGWVARLGDGSKQVEGRGVTAVEALSSLLFQVHYGAYKFDMTIGPH